MKQEDKRVSPYGSTPISLPAMTKEEKSLLIQDLCARLPYGTMIQCSGDWAVLDAELKFGHIERLRYDEIEVKPYLRPMSSMTEEEVNELYILLYRVERIGIPDINKEHNAISLLYDWFNKNHIDYRGFIEKGLAIEAPKDMYK